MPTVLEATLAPTATRPPPGIVMICDQAAAVSVLAEECSDRPLGPEVYAELAAVILRQTRFDVVLHLRCGGKKAAAIRQAIERGGQLSACNRLRISEAAPLATALAGVDLLISFASPALIAGCRSGLKPVQIGRAITGSAAFSHVFRDVRGFAEALANGGLAGCLSVHEYEQFEDFCRALRVGRAAAAPGTFADLRALARDPIVQECRRSEPAGRSLIRTIAAAIANPVAALRLLRGDFRRSATR